ncbi:hypothetical protein BDAP_001566 [Binucleata daphniae]
MVVPCIIVGCNCRTVKLDTTPPNYRQPPDAVICMECGRRNDAVYRRDDFYFAICFLDCCRISKGNPYLSCAICHANLGDFGTFVCTKCRTASPSQFLHCPHCGQRQEY